MFESFSHKIRKILDAPLPQKGFIFWILSPLLWLVSFIIFLVASNRRKARSLTPLDPGFRQGDTDKPLIISIGNIIIGGTGKSPVVQKIAQSYIQRGFVVAIAARGVGKNNSEIYLSNKDNSDKFNFLSDENREHYELLKYYSRNENLFYILQNKNRLASLQYFISEMKKINQDLKKTVFILDDGLQHFACPRDINICLWSPELLLKSPYYAMPLGPYREGFGKKSFQHLLETFNYRFWARTQEKNLAQYSNDVSVTLNKFGLKPSSKDIFLVYEMFFWEINFSHNSVSLKTALSKQAVIQKIEHCKNVCVLTGIANPQRFIADISAIVSIKNMLDILCLDDHAALTQNALSLLQKSDTVVVTLKDFLRWSTNKEFLAEVSNQCVIVCSVALDFYNIAQEHVEVKSLF